MPADDDKPLELAAIVELPAAAADDDAPPADDDDEPAAVDEALDELPAADVLAEGETIILGHPLLLLTAGGGWMVAAPPPLAPAVATLAEDTFGPVGGKFWHGWSQGSKTEKENVG